MDKDMDIDTDEDDAEGEQEVLEGSADCEEEETTEEQERKRAKVSTNCFIAIHLGAGEYTLTGKRKELFKALCRKACKEGMKALDNGASADEAVTIATVILENSKLVNAGIGSSLTIDKMVECDAGFMNGNGYFGGVGAVQGVRNPILIARKIADMQKDKPILSCGRIPPIYLCGKGAKVWAEEHGVPVSKADALITDRSERTYMRYMKRLEHAENGVPENLSFGVSDTVGAVALDKTGHVAATVSSGGNWLKHSGRVGHAPVFGSGCWASNCGAKTPAVTISSSGSGEMLAKIQLPRAVYKAVESETFLGLVEAVSTAISQELLGNALLNCHREKRNVGIVALTWDDRLKRGEFAWGHTSKCFALAYLDSVCSSVKVHFSELQGPRSQSKNESLKVTGMLL